MPKITFDVLCEPDRPGVPDEDLAIDRLGAAQVRPVRLGNPNHCAIFAVVPISFGQFIQRKRTTAQGVALTTVEVHC